jgi:hypothetical protein
MELEKVDYIILPIISKEIKLNMKQHEEEYKNKLAEDYMCQICICLVNSPRMCDKCDKLFCDACLTKWLATNKTCPNCHLKFKEARIQRTVKNTLEKFEIICPNSPDCTEEFPCEKLEEHLKKCNFSKIEAKCLGCNCLIITSTSRSEIINHVTSCPKIKEICDYCKKPIERASIKQHIQSKHKKIKCEECNQYFLYLNFKNHSWKECTNKIRENLNEIIKDKDTIIKNLEKKIKNNNFSSSYINNNITSSLTNKKSLPINNITTSINKRKKKSKKQKYKSNYNNNNNNNNSKESNTDNNSGFLTRTFGYIKGLFNNIVKKDNDGEDEVYHSKEEDCHDDD